jgi:hypothetical protein
LENGAVQDTETEPSSTDSMTTSEGAEGAVDGTIGRLPSDGSPSPEMLVAVTVKT